MNNYKSQLAINSALVEYYDDSSDWMIEEMPYIVAHMGPDAIRMLTLMLQNSVVDPYIRNGMARALIMIIIKNPETKQQIIQIIKETAQKESDKTIRMFIVNPLLDLRDPDLYQYLKDFIQTGFIADDFCDLEWLDVVHDGNDYRNNDITPRDPLDIFSCNSENFYQKTNNPPPPEPYNPKSIGRNDACPCGSGKKYKKCCMRKI